jgi:hypothetical protein
VNDARGHVRGPTVRLLSPVHEPRCHPVGCLVDRDVRADQIGGRNLFVDEGTQVIESNRLPACDPDEQPGPYRGGLIGDAGWGVR